MKRTMLIIGGIVALALLIGGAAYVGGLLFRSQQQAQVTNNTQGAPRKLVTPAAIALLAAVALGAVLLVVLQNYYSRAELDYLDANAQVISGRVLKMTLGGVAHDEAQAQIENLGFLSQTRVRIFDMNGRVLYDSGVPQKTTIALDNPKQKLAAASSRDKSPQTKIITPASDNGAPSKTPDPSSSGDKSNDRSIQVVGSPFGFYLDANVPLGGARSNQVVKMPIEGPDGNKIGTVILSDGPALGSDILFRVARGWVVASAIAVLFAAGVGWFISQRISAPVLALTAVTGRMAAGDLSSRANVKNRDEFGRLARSFNEMANQVEATVSALRRFVSDAAHELQTPVTALQTNLDLAAAEDDANARRVFLTRAQALVERLDELNNELLDLSRLEANSLSASITLTPIDLTALVRQNSEMFASQAEQAGLVFELQIPDAPLYIRAEAGQVQRALGNLVDNTCKFTPAGGTVRVELEREQSRVVCAVSDTGIGIPADDMPQLFSRFHRGRNATAFPGSGLGLAIVKAIMQQQGGQVAVENLSQGARVTLMWYSLEPQTTRAG